MAEHKAKAKAEDVEEVETGKHGKSELIAVKKDGVVIRIHPAALVNHRALGWVPE